MYTAFVLVCLALVVKGHLSGQNTDVYSIATTGIPLIPPRFPVASFLPSYEDMVANSNISPHDGDLNVETENLECAQFHTYCNSTERVEPETCSCKSDCVLYGNCCWDSHFDYGQETIYSCTHLVRPFGIENYYMISSCPKDWIIQDVKAHCESPFNTEQEDVFVWVPVSNHETNKTYKNIFCAACHGDRTVRPWKINVLCGEVPDIDTNIMESDICFKYAVIPTSLSIETCSMDIENCDPYWLNFGSESKIATLKADIIRKCKIYSAPVTSSDSPSHMIYKNKFCAFCNSEKPENLACFEPRFIWNDDVFYTTFIPPLSFSVLMDIDFSSGDHVGISCPRGYSFDPVKRKCRSVWCGSKFTDVNGTCVENLKAKGHVYDVDKPTVPQVNCTPRQCIGQVMKPEIEHNVSVHSSHSNSGNDNFLSPEKGVENHDHEIEGNKFGNVHVLLTLVSVGLSLTCLLIKMVLHLLTHEDKLKTAPRAIFCLSCTLFLAQVSFLLAGAVSTEWRVSCVAVAMVTHFCYLSSFHWTNALAFDIWRTFSLQTGPSPWNSAAKAKQRFVRYALYSWTTPAVIVGIAALFEWAIPAKLWRPNYGEHYCWFGSRRGLLAFFAVPLASVLLLDGAFFALTAFHICKTVRATRFARENNRKYYIRFGLYIKLALVMGLTWAFGFVAPFTDGDVMWYVFIVLNAVQGVFILFAFTQFGCLWQALKASLSKKTKRSSQSERLKDGNNSNQTRSTRVFNNSLNVTSHV